MKDVQRSPLEDPQPGDIVKKLGNRNVFLFREVLTREDFSSVTFISYSEGSQSKGSEIKNWLSTWHRWAIGAEVVFTSELEEKANEEKTEKRKRRRRRRAGAEEAR